MSLEGLGLVAELDHVAIAVPSIDEARKVFAAAGDRPGESPPLSDDFESLRWFPLPHEVTEPSPEPRESAPAT